MAKQLRVGFLGAGNMARYLVGGLIADGYNSEFISVSHPRQQQLDQFSQQFQINTFRDNNELSKNVDILVLCVKPQVLPTVAVEIAKTVLEKTPLVVSIAAGVKLETLQQWFSEHTSIIRCMPNTAALVHCAAIALFANQASSSEQKDQAESLMRTVGMTRWLDDEKHMDIITALSGSGPAYFYYLMEALSEAAVKEGLPEETAELFIMQTALGSSRLALEAETDFAGLRNSVTSRGGTTESALQVFEDKHLKEIIISGVRAACNRSRELADLFSSTDD